MEKAAQPEVWLRGAVDGIDPLLMPVAHALIQAREDVQGLAGVVPEARVWERPGGAASVGFHVRHLGGALVRLRRSRPKPRVMNPRPKPSRRQRSRSGHRRVVARSMA